MNRSIRITGTELQWKGDSGDINVVEGILQPDGSGTAWNNRKAGSFWKSGPDLYYIDRGGSRKMRKLIGKTRGPGPEGGVDGSVWIQGDVILYIHNGGLYEIDQHSGDTKPHNLSIQQTNFTTGQVTATWDNASTSDAITIQWRVNGGDAGFNLAAGTTSHARNYNQGDSVQFRVRYRTGDDIGYSDYSSTIIVQIIQ